MRILFTGASSFTGYWFVRELVAANPKTRGLVAVKDGAGGV
jgi:nucleoside-diphosphate-sugar epimerase